MKRVRIDQKRNILQYILFLVMFFSLHLGVLHVYSQLGDAPLNASKWYYFKRAYPYDTIPAGAFENAVAQRKALFLSKGYQFPAPSRWDEIGPKPLGYGLGSSGRIAQVVYDKLDPNEDGSGRVIYVTGASGGLWKTIDGGVNWQKKSGVVPNELPTLSAGAFAVSYVNNNKILYFGTNYGTQLYNDARGLGIFKSTDDGQSWAKISNGLKPGTAVYKIVISPNDPTRNTIFAATFNGLYKTTNAGDLWIKVVPIADEELICTDVCFSPSGSWVYAVGPSEGETPPWDYFDGIGFWRSDDGGNNFAPIRDAGFPHSTNVLARRTLCAVSKASEAEEYVWFISFDNVCCNVYVYKSTNHGQTFSNTVVGDGNGATKYQLVLRPSDEDRFTCFAGSENLYKTTNGGTTWDCVDGYYWRGCPDNTHPDFLALEFNPFDPEKITVGNDGGVFRSDNLGINWASCNQNLGSLALLWGLASSTYDAGFLAGGLHDYGYGYNPSAGPSSTYWYSIDFGADGGGMSASPFKSKHFVANKVYNLSIDFSYNGSNFQDAHDYAETTTICNETGAFAQHPTQPGVVYTVRFNGFQNPQIVHFRKTTNYGANWGGDATPFREFQRLTDGDKTAPSFLAISQSNPNTIIMAICNGNEFWLNAYDARSRLLKSANGGLTWEGIDYGDPIVYGGQPGRGLPDRSFTDVEFDPKDKNLLYLTVSGYYYPGVDAGHVFKSTDGGYNWTNISGNLPDIPVNDLIIHYNGTGSNDKELIVATDAGIYASNAVSIDWGEIAGEFPNTPAFHLDYNRLSSKLRVNTWGRGGWEFERDNTVYVQDVLYITDNVTLDKQIIVANGGKLILGHPEVNSSITLTFNNGANIQVQDGGEIDASSGVAITLTSSSTWSGIEFQGTGYGTLNNCTFSNTTTPVSITGGLGEVQGILIDNCNFSAPISINTRPNVTIQNSHWNYTAQPPGSIACVYSIGSNNIDINTNYLNASPSSVFIDAVAISVISGQSITIVSNDLNKCSNGIDVHNSSNAFVNQNTITSGSSEQSSTGIFMDYAYSTTLRYNTINDFPTGIYMINSSPTLYINDIDNSTGNQPVGIMLASNSYPRMRPLYDQPYQFWDAGYNFIFNESPTNNQSISFSIDHSLPDVGYGYNRIKAAQYYVDGCNVCNPSEYPWHAQYNCWSELPPNMDKFHFTDPCVIYIEEYTCGPPPGGGSHKSEISEKEPTDVAKEAVPNPDPIIVNRGNGVYDTVKVTSGAQIITNDNSIYFNGVKNELLTNYSTAIVLFRQVIQNYQDSTTAILSLKRILTCRDKMNFDSTAYSSLRAYYQQLAQNNMSDTSFANIASELAVKCLVRLKNYEQAIGEYESIIANTTDSIKILGCELNIIEIYMMMGSGGDSPGFTGKIAQLKPQTVEDGFRLINEKLNRRTHSRMKEQLPTVFSLSQNYPNPFNPLTKINYAIPKKTNVTLKIYDILGRLVKTLVNEFKEPGYYTVHFDGSAYASGVYFYKIEAGDFVQSKKMVLVK